jgi:excisionase family DNA binding protein
MRTIKGLSSMEKLLNKEEVMAMLGIARSTLYCWISQRKIPHVKVGRLLRFKETDIHQWLNDRIVRPQSAEASQSTRIKRVRPRSPKAYDDVQRLVNNAKKDILKK